MGRGAETRSRILDEAMRLASRDGLEGLTIGTLAKALEMSKSGLFIHFGSKEALQVAVLEHAGLCFQAFVAERLQEVPEGRPRLLGLLKSWLDWIDRPDLPGGCPVMGAAFEFDDREGAPRDFLVARQQRAEAWLADEFQAALPQVEDLPQLLFGFRSLTLGYHFQSRVMRDPEARRKAEQAFLGLIENA